MWLATKSPNAHAKSLNPQIPHLNHFNPAPLNATSTMLSSSQDIILRYAPKKGQTSHAIE